MSGCAAVGRDSLAGEDDEGCKALEFLGAMPAVEGVGVVLADDKGELGVIPVLRISIQSREE